MEELFFKWNGLKKSWNQRVSKLLSDDSFLNKFEQPFGVSYTNAVDHIEKDLDNLFLENQSKPGCWGCMLELDKVVSQKEVKEASNKQLLEKRKRSQLEKLSPFESAVLETSTDDVGANFSEKQSCTHAKTLNPFKNRRRTVKSPQLAGVFDCIQVSDRAAATISF